MNGKTRCWLLLIPLCEPLNGSVILAAGGRDNEEGPALFEMGHSSAVRGLTGFYPEQRTTNIHPYMWRNCEAFIFGRTDWGYVNNTFVFPVNIGYRFIQTKAAAANGQFSGIGADEAQVCVKDAIITGNNGARGVEIVNEIGERAIITNNEPGPK
jgi:hypothetical protein